MAVTLLYSTEFSKPALQKTICGIFSACHLISVREKITKDSESHSRDKHHSARDRFGIFGVFTPYRYEMTDTSASDIYSNLFTKICTTSMEFSDRPCPHVRPLASPVAEWPLPVACRSPDTRSSCQSLFLALCQRLYTRPDDWLYCCATWPAVCWRPDVQFGPAPNKNNFKKQNSSALAAVALDQLVSDVNCILGIKCAFLLIFCAVL